MKLMSATKTQVKMFVNKNTSVVAYHIWYFVFSYITTEVTEITTEKFWDKWRLWKKKLEKQFDFDWLGSQQQNN